MSNRRQIHFAVGVEYLHFHMLWATDGSPWTRENYYDHNPAYYEHIARLFERGKFDMVFLADAANTSTAYGGSFEAAIRHGFFWPRHDPTPLATIMARATERIGIALTMSTTYHHPFHVARLMASLDSVSNGRIAWNAVTSALQNEGQNYGFDPLLPAAARYRRAQEHLEVCTKLWASVGQDLLVLDRDEHVFADPDQVSSIDHHGEHFTLPGPLPTLPSPQGRPVIIQAGQSEDGLALAARFADAQYALRTDLEGMLVHREALGAALEAAGRPRDAVKIFWGIRVNLGDTAAERDAHEKAYFDRFPPDYGLLNISTLFGVDLSALDPALTLGEAAPLVAGKHGFGGAFQEVLRSYGADITLREFGLHSLKASALTISGNLTEVCDQLEELHDGSGANGGFLLSYPYALSDLERFVDEVVPELQRRGRMRTEYAGIHLRDHLGQD